MAQAIPHPTTTNGERHPPNPPEAARCARGTPTASQGPDSLRSVVGHLVPTYTRLCSSRSGKERGERPHMTRGFSRQRDPVSCGSGDVPFL
eukprot:1420530-Prymnesium_polylepis.1